MKTITVFVLLTISFSLYAQVSRIEPPHWWTGMKDPHLQLMVYGKDVGMTSPKIQSKAIRITGYNSPQNKDYLFINVEIKKNTRPGSFEILLLKNDETVASIPYTLYQKSQGTDRGYDASDIIYLITPDRFANGDVSNDNITGMEDGLNRNDPLGRHGGDIDGIRQHLDYIRNLGMTAIWLNPVLENNMPRHSYHGYATTDFYSVDPRFGTNESYKALCEEASAMGIKVIMDMIVNHCGSNHWWMPSPPTDDWINYFNKPYVQTNHRKTLSMDPYAAPPDVAQLTDGWFVRSMPDLNVRNPYLQQYLIQNAIWWIEYAGLAGIRMDTYLYPDEDFMSAWAGRIMQEYPDFNISGEVWHDNPAVVSYWQQGKNNTNQYQSNLRSLFDFPIQSALVKALNAKENWDSGWVVLYEMLAQDHQYPDPNNLVVFADNHDMSRIYTQLGEDMDKFKMAIAYIMTVRGIPQLYYGTELLMTNPGTDNHGVIRADFPGGWNGDEVNAFLGNQLNEQQQEAMHFIMRLAAWRKNEQVIHQGKTMHFIPQDGVYVYFRYDQQKKIMVILNKNEKTTTLSMDRFADILDGKTTGENILTGYTVSLTGEMTLTGPGPLIIDIR